MAKASNNEFPSVLFAEQTSDPATPAAGTGRLFYKDDGKWWTIDDAGTVAQVPTATGTPDGTKFLRDDGVWATPAGGGGSAGITLIDEQQLASDGTFSFSSIPSTYTDLLIVGELRSDVASSTDTCGVRVGAGTADTGSNYDWQYAGSGTAGSDSTSPGRFSPSVIGNSGTTGRFTVVTATLRRYADTSQYRTIASRSQGGSGTTPKVYDSITWWKNTTDAIDIVEIFPNGGTNFKAGSSLRLYGRA